jgi:hypothetical protein
VSRATRPNTVLARPGTTTRDAIRQRLLLRDRSSCAELVRTGAPPEYRATVVCLRVGEPTVRWVPLGERQLGRYVLPAEVAAFTRKRKRRPGLATAGNCMEPTVVAGGACPCGARLAAGGTSPPDTGSA